MGFRAMDLTGVGISFCPRPLGRSGWVTTPISSWGESRRASSEGQANSDGAQEEDLQPFPSFFFLQQFLFEEIPFQSAEPVDEEDPVQVVNFVLQGNRQQVLPESPVFPLEVLKRTTTFLLRLTSSLQSGMLRQPSSQVHSPSAATISGLMSTIRFLGWSAG